MIFDHRYGQNSFYKNIFTFFIDFDERKKWNKSSLQSIDISNFLDIKIVQIKTENGDANLASHSHSLRSFGKDSLCDPNVIDNDPWFVIKNTGTQLVWYPEYSGNQSVYYLWFTLLAGTGFGYAWVRSQMRFKAWSDHCH